MPGSREASHAGSWYTNDGKRLTAQLQRWLDAVPEHIQGIAATSKDEAPVRTGPVKGARVIIAPHAGYTYSGSAAAWAYKSWDVSRTKRVFVLGPSHHFYLTGCALSQYSTYSTPLGALHLDTDVIEQLEKTRKFDKMSATTDTEEHSIEMHLPYIYHMLKAQFVDGKLPPIVPILVGNTSAATEREYGELLKSYLADEENAFVVSSDFAHWGSRFRYTFYRSDRHSTGVTLKASSKTPTAPAIYESIADVDGECMGACESGSHSEWLDVLADTGNTVCGRHPIGIVLSGIESLGSGPPYGRFKFVRYERSDDVHTLRDSSVSYCSAYAVL